MSSLLDFFSSLGSRNKRNDNVLTTAGRLSSFDFSMEQKWRTKRLSVGRYIDDDTFIAMIREVLNYVGNSLHNLSKITFLQRATQYPLNIDEFLLYAKTMQKSPF